MSLFALTEFWNEFCAVGGLIFGLLGFLVGVLGFWYTILQVRKTKDAALAAQHAAERAYEISYQRVRSSLTGLASRFISELREFVDQRQWDLAKQRANDVAELLALFPIEDSELAELCSLLREWTHRFQRLNSGSLKKLPGVNWTKFLEKLQRKMDSFRGPFVADAEVES